MFGQDLVDLALGPPPVRWVEGRYLFFFIVVVGLAARGRVVLAVADVVVVIVLGDLRLRL